MFTGLIEAVGQVAEVEATTSGFRLRLMTGLANELSSGESLAVNGVCLTVVSADGGIANMDVSPETIRVSALGLLKRGTSVNLERSMRADARVGGHFVQGHVDATGVVEEIRQDGDYWWLTIRYPQTHAPQLVRKGSVAVDGISLTVAGLDASRFDVQIVPFTWQHTNLRHLRVNDVVNLEFDLLGKYVLRALDVARK